MTEWKRNAFRCRKCGMVVESKSVHDFQECKCGNFTDGGLEYIRRGGKIEDMEDLSEPKAYFDIDEEDNLNEENSVLPETEKEKQFISIRNTVQATADLSAALACLEKANEQKPSKTISMAITKVEEALMWLRKGE